RSAALLRERAAAFVRRACVEREGEELHQIADGLRLENHRVATGLDRHRIARQTRLLDRASSDVLHVHFRPVWMIGARPTGARSVCRAYGERVVRRRAGLIGEQTLVVADGPCADSCDQEAGGLQITRRLTRLDRLTRRFGACFGAEAA